MKFTITLFGLLFVLNSISAQTRPAKLWDATFGGSDTDMGYKVIETSDKNYLIVGSSGSGISGDKTEDKKGQTGFTDFWVVKTTKLGEKLWDKTYGGRYTDLCRTAIETSDGGFLIGGYSESDISGDKSQTGNGGKDYWVIKINANGEKQWDASFGGSRDEDLKSIVETPDGGFLLGGESDSRITGDKTEENRDLNALRTDYWIIKITSTGTKVWDKTYGSNSHDQLRKIVKCNTGGYLLLGTTYSNAGGEKSDYLRGDYNLGSADFWAIRITENGTKRWDKSYGGSGLDDAKAAVQTLDGGFLLAGGSRSPISYEKSDSCRGSNDSWLVKIDSLGAVSWDKTFGGDGEETVDEVLQNADGTYLFATSSGSNVVGEKSQAKMGWFDYWVVKVNTDGTKIWDGTYGGNDGDYCYTLTRCSDNGILVGGQSSSNISAHKSQNSRGTIDYWLIKLLDNEISLSTPSDTLCLGSDVTVNYSLRGIFNSGNTSILQLSDATGSFTTPQNLDTLSVEGSGTFTGNISISIPSNLPEGNLYRLRVISSNPMDTSYSRNLVVRNCCDVFLNPTAFNRTGELYNTINCEGQSIVLEASSVVGATGYQWTGPNNFNSNLRNPIVENILSTNTGYYVVYAFNGACVSEKDSVLVTVKLRPAIPTISNDGPYTNGQTIHLSTTTTAAVYEWTGVYPFNSNEQNPTILNANNSKAGTYHLKVGNGECWSELASTIVVVDGISSLVENKSDNFDIFPNPVKAGQQIEIRSGKAIENQESIVCRVINLSGKRVFETILNHSKMQLPQIESGVYVIEILTNTSTIHRTLIVE